MKKIVYLLLLLSICLIPRTTFAATKVNASNESELRSAMEATTDNEIELTNDVEITYDSSLNDEENFLIVTKGNHVLNLNNHSITTESNSQADYGIITVLGGSLEIKGDGTISAPNVVLSVMDGKLIISGGTYISGDQNHVDIVLMTYGGTIIVNKGTFTGDTYAEGPDASTGGSGSGNGPSQGSSLPILSSNVAATVHSNRNNASQRLGAPMDTKPNIAINDGTFNNTTYVYNTDLTINGGNFAGENAVEVAGSNSKIKITDGNLNGDDIALVVNTASGDPSVQLNGGTYSCTECGDQQMTFGAITIGPFQEQKDGSGLLNNLLGENATIDDNTVEEATADYDGINAFYYHTNKTVKVSTPIQPKENQESANKKNEVDNPETSDNILLSVIALISSLSLILVSAKKLNNN